MHTEESPIVEFRNADISNGEIVIVEDVNFTIDRGEFVYLTGKVGCGKTSIIRTLTGENPLAGGYCRVGDFELSSLKRKQIPYLRRSIGIIFQDFQLLMDRSIEDNLRFVLRSTGWKDRVLMDERIEKVLRMVGLSSKGHRMPHQLSGGEQQRAVIARSLLNGPELILADEPTGNLDEETAHEIMYLLLKINSSGTAVIMVTHNQSLMADHPARTLICENGTCR
ncbi:MAG: ATP-binding cassette domain-containing protein [Bacteroidales bacterium]|nr:ATP-binding cassette domain-containing protein [Bacteroidales bacterium]